MPELPEVETIRRGIAPLVTGQTIRDVEVRDGRLRWPVDAGALHEYVAGQSIAGVERRSKYLIFTMGNRAHLIIHLGMSGSLGLYRPDDETQPHTHLVFYLNDLEMRYRDPRRFGYIDVLPPGAIDDYIRFRHLGPEPLSDEFSVTYLEKILRGRSGAIKSLLMNAEIVVGVGNIYANEALFRAGIHPARSAGLLSDDEIATLVDAVKAVLADAVKSGGTSLRDYRNALGETGYFQLQLSVYQKDGEACPRCGGVIERSTITGRGTFFCAGCQR